MKKIFLLGISFLLFSGCLFQQSVNEVGEETKKTWQEKKAAAKEVLQKGQEKLDDGKSTLKEVQKRGEKTLSNIQNATQKINEANEAVNTIFQKDESSEEETEKKPETP